MENLQRMGVVHSSYSAWLPLSGALSQGSLEGAKRITVGTVFIVAVFIFVLRFKRSRRTSKGQALSGEAALAETQKKKEHLDSNKWKRRAPSAFVRTPFLSPSHGWQNTGLRRSSKHKQAPVASRHFHADNAAGIPIGYYAVGEGDSPENEMVRLYEDQ